MLKVFATFPEENIHEKKNTSFKKKSCNFRVCADFLSVSWWKQSGKMFKTAFQLSRRAFVLENFPIEKIRSFFQILELEENWFDSFAETFWQLKRSCKLPVHRNNLKKKHFLFSTNLFFLAWGLRQRHFRSFRHYTFLSVLSELHSTYTEERFDESSFFQKFGIVKPVPDFEWKVSWLLAGKHRHSCRNCTCVSSLHLEEHFFWRLCKSFLSFLYFDWLSFNFDLNFSAGFSKLQSTCQTINSRKNIWCEIFFLIFQTSSDLREKLSDIWRQLFGSVVKNALFVSAEQGEGLLFRKIVYGVNHFRTSR